MKMYFWLAIIKYITDKILHLKTVLNSKNLTLCWFSQESRPWPIQAPAGRNSMETVLERREVQDDLSVLERRKLDDLQGSAPPSSRMKEERKNERRKKELKKKERKKTESWWAANGAEVVGNLHGWASSCWLNWNMKGKGREGGSWVRCPDRNVKALPEHAGMDKIRKAKAQLGFNLMRDMKDDNKSF